MPDSNSDFSTVLGPDAVFKGQLQFEKGVQLLGKFEGEIDSGGHLVVADGANLIGDAKADNIRIDGQVAGNLDAGQKIELTASAKVEGDIHTARLEVAEGAVLVGRCMVGVNGKSGLSGGAVSPTAQPKPAAAADKEDASKAKGGSVPAPVGKK